MALAEIGPDKCTVLADAGLELLKVDPDMKEGHRMPGLPSEERSTDKSTAGYATGLTARRQAPVGEA